MWDWGMDWIDLAQDRDRMRAVAANLFFPPHKYLTTSRRFAYPLSEDVNV
jgi:hypothetical protein